MRGVREALSLEMMIYAIHDELSATRTHTSQLRQIAKQQELAG